MLSGMTKNSLSIRSKFTIVFGIMFLLSTTVPLALTLLFTFESLKESNRSEIADKAAELQLEYELGGLKAVIKAVEIDNTMRLDRPYFIRISGRDSNSTVYSSIPSSWMGFNFAGLEDRGVQNPDQFIVLRQTNADYAIEILTRSLSDAYVLQVGSSNRMREHVITSSIHTFLTVMIPFTLVIILLVWILSSSMLKPISNVVEAVQKVIYTGNYDQQIPMQRNSMEFDELVRLINKMFSKLNTLITNLKGTLETVAHDIRTPMTRIRTRAEVALQQQNDPDEMRSTLQTIVKESEKISSLMRLILDAAEAESGIVKIEEREFDLIAVCREAVEVYQYLADGKAVTLSLRSPEKLIINADPARIQQAIGNLLDNAVKYTNGGTTVEVEVKLIAEYVNVIIRDQGLGINENMIEDIWRPRYRLPRNEKSNGYGLGLTIVKAVADAHNGSVSVKNRSGSGAEFTFSLPGVRIIN
ncbi:MAG: HAMP domain-containing histidine kinase [Spirochaetaceae bacterium]|nr:HAMP domain-containing histidine kinase [Spirochaetaceae bacterium]MCF7951492.1 HAMP domain-containing histidine kinase [Spirochaetaceae bacterium]